MFTRDEMHFCFAQQESVDAVRFSAEITIFTRRRKENIPQNFCISGLEPGNPNFTVGEPFNITCVLNISQEYNVTDVFFTITTSTEHVRVDSSFVSVTNETQVELQHPKAEQWMDHSWVECCLPDRPVVASNQLYVGRELSICEKKIKIIIIIKK